MAIKTKLPLLSVLPILLLGCATNGPAMHQSVARVASVAPQSYPGDPQGYLQALVGSPGQLAANGSGVWWWSAKRERFSNIYQSIRTWCTANGGTMPKQLDTSMACVTPQGTALAQFRFSLGVPDMEVGLLSGERAQAAEARFRASADAHHAYVASGGAAGFVTLKGGTRVEVLRIGTPKTPIDYDLYSIANGVPHRRLYEVRSVETLPAANGQAGARYKVVFRDGTVSTAEYRLSNQFKEYAPGRTVSRANATLFAGVGSRHLAMVVRRNPKAKPSNAAIAIEDIVKLEITKLDPSPAAQIEVATSDQDLERTIRAKWRKAALSEGRVPFNYDGVYSPWCYRVTNMPIEIAYLCAQLSAERALAERRGYYDPEATPASLGSESTYKLGERTIF